MPSSTTTRNRTSEQAHCLRSAASRFDSTVASFSRLQAPRRPAPCSTRIPVGLEDRARRSTSRACLFLGFLAPRVATLLRTQLVVQVGSRRAGSTSPLDLALRLVPLPQQRATAPGCCCTGSGARCSGSAAASAARRASDLSAGLRRLPGRVPVQQLVVVELQRLILVRGPEVRQRHVRASTPIRSAPRGGLESRVEGHVRRNEDPAGRLRRREAPPP